MDGAQGLANTSAQQVHCSLRSRVTRVMRRSEPSERRTETGKGALYATTREVPGGSRAQSCSGTDPHRDDGRTSASCPKRLAADLCRLWQAGHDQPAQGLLYPWAMEKLHIRLHRPEHRLGS